MTVPIKSFEEIMQEMYQRQKKYELFETWELAKPNYVYCVKVDLRSEDNETLKEYFIEGAFDIYYSPTAIITATYYRRSFPIIRYDHELALLRNTGESEIAKVLCDLIDKYKPSVEKSHEMEMNLKKLVGSVSCMND